TLAGLLRITRSTFLDVLDADYLRVARTKGLGERIVILRHALRNTLIPIVTYAGFSFALFLSGSVIVESLFRWPGLGLLASESVFSRDYPLLQGILLVVIAWVVLVNLLTDLLYAILDPQVRYT